MSDTHDTHKDKLILTLLAAWETSLHNVDTLREIVQEVPGWELKFDRYHRDYERNRHTMNRLAPVRDAIREILGEPESPGGGNLIEMTYKQLNQKLN